ncbi:MAG: gliding motility protein GldN [Paludibacteraceae bacterium]
MKKLFFIVLLFAGVFTANAQHQINSFFNQNGTIRLETQELDEASDTLASVFHRTEDVVWSRLIYRVIDMRYKQNYQLYFPVTSADPQYRNLFKVMLDAIVDGMPVYEKSQEPGDIKPRLETPLAKDQIPGLLNTDREGISDGDIATSDYMLIHYDSVTDKMSFNDYMYQQYVRNQLKFMILEVVFFDKHYSRLFSKIIAIAPMSSEDIEGEDTPITDALYQSIRFWVVYDDFRPYMARQYMIPQNNDSKRVTFEQFFAQKLYTSYIIGDSNMYDRMLAEAATRGRDEQEDKAIIEKELKKEQQRIENELMTFELDLWEY